MGRLGAHAESARVARGRMIHVVLEAVAERLQHIYPAVADLVLISAAQTSTNHTSDFDRHLPRSQYRSEQPRYLRQNHPGRRRRSHGHEGDDGEACGSGRWQEGRQGEGGGRRRRREGEQGGARAGRDAHQLPQGRDGPFRHARRPLPRLAVEYAGMHQLAWLFWTVAMIYFVGCACFLGSCFLASVRRGFHGLLCVERSSPLLWRSSPLLGDGSCWSKCTRRMAGAIHTTTATPPSRASATSNVVDLVFAELGPSYDVSAENDVLSERNILEGYLACRD